MNKQNYDLLIRNGDVALSTGMRKLDIGIKDGRFSALGSSLTGNAKREIDAKGKMVFPGFMDTHTHMGIPIKNTTSADNFASGSGAAAFGGVTTIMDFTVQRKGQSLKDALEERIRLARGKSSVDYGIHINITDQPEKWLPQIPELIDEGFTSFKVFSTYREAGMMVEWDQFRKILQQVHSRGGMLMLHAEDNDLVESLTKKHVAAGHFEPIYHARSRPAEAEAKAITNAARIAGELDASLYIVHLSSRAGLEAAVNAREQGVKLYLETCPQYLLLTEDCYKQEEGHNCIATPPLRKQEDCQALWQALHDGIIDTVGTDHCPFTMKQKNMGGGKFYLTPNGLPGVETLFPLLYTYGVRKGRIPLQRLLEVLVVNPARIFGFSRKKGEIRVGSDADLVIWNAEVETEISISRLHGGADWSPYQGLPIAGKLEYTILRGEVLIEGERWVGNAGAGTLVRAGE